MSKAIVNELHINKTKVMFTLMFIYTATDDTNQKKIKGRLSSRMLIPGNTWQVVWKAAKPVPARRQVSFFFTFHPEC